MELLMMKSLPYSCFIDEIGGFLLKLLYTICNMPSYLFGSVIKYILSEM